MRYILAMEYYLALSRKEILQHTTWLTLEGVTLEEMSQSQKDKGDMLALT